MVFNHSVSPVIISHNFPSFAVGNTALKFVTEFECLGNIIAQESARSCGHQA